MTHQPSRYTKFAVALWEHPACESWHQWPGHARVCNIGGIHSNSAGQVNIYSILGSCHLYLPILTTSYNTPRGPHQQYGPCPRRHLRYSRSSALASIDCVMKFASRNFNRKMRVEGLVLSASSLSSSGSSGGQSSFVVSGSMLSSRNMICVSCRQTNFLYTSKSNTEKGLGSPAGANLELNNSVLIMCIFFNTYTYTHTLRHIYLLQKNCNLAAFEPLCRSPSLEWHTRSTQNTSQTLNPKP